ncbi:MAG: adenosylmethionine decarboxylase [Verrucomicrobia bacterium]|nr:adenosylmethionine decarboxylase [Verrucomicrobiota bacterium]
MLQPELRLLNHKEWSIKTSFFDFNWYTITPPRWYTFSPALTPINAGVSGVVMISSSHITIHTWPEHGYAALDIFTCGPGADPEKAVDFFRKELEADDCQIRDFQRGIPRETRTPQEHQHSLA